MLEALAEAVGVELVGQKYREVINKKLTEKSERDQTSIRVALEKGNIAVTDKATPDTILVLKETAPDGQTVGNGKTVLHINEIVPEMLAQVVNQPVGTVLDTPNGGKVEILEMYVPATPPEVTDSTTVTE